MTYPEVLLWQRLRGSPAGLKFRRQHAIGLDCIADFYCASARLIVEVDGQIHSQPGVMARDVRKDATYLERGLTVIRVPARDILRNADESAAALVALASKPLHHRPAAGGPPPQQAGEEQR